MTESRRVHWRPNRFGASKNPRLAKYPHESAFWRIAALYSGKYGLFRSLELRAR